MIEIENFKRNDNGPPAGRLSFGSMDADRIQEAGGGEMTDR